MLVLNDHNGLWMSNRSTAQHRVCLSLSSADQTVSRHRAGIHLPEVSGQVPRKAMQVHFEVVTKPLQKHHRSVAAPSWSHNHHRYLNVVSPVQITRQQQAQHFTHHQGHHHPLWNPHHEEDQRTFRKGSSLFLAKGQRCRKTTYQCRNPHLLPQLHSRHRRSPQCPSLLRQCPNQYSSLQPNRSQRRSQRQSQLLLRL
jgi:hypothetical protein